MKRSAILLAALPLAAAALAQPVIAEVGPPAPGARASAAPSAKPAAPVAKTSAAPQATPQPSAKPAAPPRALVVTPAATPKPVRKAVVPVVVAAPRPAAAPAGWAARFSNDDRTLPIAVGKSAVLTTDSPVVRVSVTDPSVTDVVVMSKNEVLVNGQKSGSTNLIVWTRNERRIYNVVVRTDADALQNLLRTSFHSDAITAEVVGKAVVLRGRVATPDLYTAATQIAEGMAEKVINLIQVDRNPQIEVEAQVVEINKNDLNKLGLSYGEVLPDQKSNPSEPGTMIFRPGQMTGAEAKQNVLQFARSRVGVSLDALFKNGVAKLLASPKLVTTSGAKASILVGGEVPVPIQQALGTTTLTWKEFGIKLGVEPVLLKEGNLKLKVASEVSSLDYANAIAVGTSSVPSIIARKADTELVLKAGESLVIGGLMQSTETVNIDKLPFLGDIPILGELFKSRRFQQQETELRIIVTPRHVVSSETPVQYKEAPDVKPLLTPKQ